MRDAHHKGDGWTTDILFRDMMIVLNRVYTATIMEL